MSQKLTGLNHVKVGVKLFHVCTSVVCKVKTGIVILTMQGRWSQLQYNEVNYILYYILDVSLYVVPYNSCSYSNNDRKHTYSLFFISMSFILTITGKHIDILDKKLIILVQFFSCSIKMHSSLLCIISDWLNVI